MKNPKASQKYNDLMHELSGLLDEYRRLLGQLERQKEETDELACCRPDKPGLPVNIWIDETEAYKNGKHDKRIMFQINRKIKFQTGNACPMTLVKHATKKRALCNDNRHPKKSRYVQTLCT